MATQDLEQVLSIMMSTVQNDLRMKRRVLSDARRRADQQMKTAKQCEEEIIELEKKQSELPVLQAVLGSRRRVYDELRGEPHLVWVDRHATNISGPVMPVFPTPDYRTAAEMYDDDEEL